MIPFPLTQFVVCFKHINYFMLHTSVISSHTKRC